MKCSNVLNMSVANDLFAQETQGLLWLLRLRWMALVTMLGVCAAAIVLHEIQVPWIVIGCVATAVVASNVTARLLPPNKHSSLRTWLRILVFGDQLLLTILLYFTGGAHNPFTVLYVLHTTLAVMLLGGREAWFMVALCGISFVLLFFSNHMLVNAEGKVLCDDLNFHLHGMVAATVVSGAGVVYFIAHLNAALAAQRQEAIYARELAEKERSMASLLAMAAGVAHELATPLSTIAVASRELEVGAQSGACGAECTGDIRLIRAEVTRCAQILERLGKSACSQQSPTGTAFTAESLRALLHGFLPDSVLAKVLWQITDIPRNVLIPGGETAFILGNMIRNAFEAGGGTATICLSAHVENGRAIFEISDNGPGLDVQLIERLGEPFFTTKSPPGLGLGWFLSKSIAERLGGKITAMPNSGSGLRVQISLPLFFTDDTRQTGENSK